MIDKKTTAERLREAFDYDPLTGFFIRKIRTGTRGPAGTRAGTPDGKGYLSLKLDGERMLAHRAAWLHVYGVWPAGFLDHINRNKSDNRIENLRLANARLNAENKGNPRADNKSGPLGVTKFRDHWRAAITSRGKRYYLGEWATAEEAHASYLTAKRLLHEGCTI